MQNNQSNSDSTNRKTFDSVQFSSINSSNAIKGINNININHHVKATLVLDSIPNINTVKNTLFTVPYRCLLNRDSLKAEARKAILEIDTIPKGLQLIYTKPMSDSIKVQQLNFSKSIFSSHLLIAKKIQPLPVVANHQNWMVPIIMLLLLLIGILRVFYQKKFTLFINAFVSRRFSNQIIREENAITQSTSLILTSVFFFSMALFLFLTGKYFNQNLIGRNDFQQFLFILLICVGFYFVKMLANKIGGYIFKVYKETDEYIFNQFLVLQIMGLLLTIWCILLNYSTIINKGYIIYLGFGTLIIGFFVRMIKSFGIANISSYSPIYIFLYLCTLEILPLLIIIKLMIR